MYFEFLLSGHSVKVVNQDFIVKCRQRMPLAILGKCQIIDTTLEGFTYPSKYQGIYTVDISNQNQQEVIVVENQVQNKKHLPANDVSNLCSILTDVLSHEDLITINQLVSNHGANNSDNEIKLTYYESKAGSQDLNNGMVNICKKILFEKLPSKVCDDGFMTIDYHADKVNVIHINNEVNPLPTSSKDTMFLGVVVLPNEETKSTSIESNILPLGKKAKNIIQELLVGSVYWLTCRTGGCCKRNTIDCPIHCASHNMKFSDKSTHPGVVLISFVKNDWGALLPPGEVDPVNTSIVLKFEDTIYKSVPCNDDGLCLFYSVSNGIINNKEINNSVPKFNDKESFISSKIMDRIWEFIRTLTSEDLNKIIERFPLEDIEKNAKQWGKRIPNMIEKHSEWVMRFMTEITNAWYSKTQRWPFEVHALFLSWIFKIRIQIVLDNWECGYICVFDSDSDEYYPSQVKSIDKTYSATCVLLFCNGNIPNNTCHWEPRNTHFEYLTPIQNPTSDEKKNA